ncbi:MAG: PASTA domain-containing protein [Flavobacteriales bacterium]|nr:PASTA domain-containing protein [Flavobacteriales bacterium]MCB9335055.1 PASTA domain-containing protein [Flavobacteriales bacterium]
MFKSLFSKAFFINLLLIISVTILIIWGIFKYLNSYTLNGETISVPQLEGLTIAEVEKTLKEKNLRYQILDSIYIEKGEKGVVLEQQPLADELVKQNRTIYITTSKIIAPKISMPDVIDMSLRLASAKIESYGLRVGKLSYFPSECVNCVLETKIKGKKIDINQAIAKGSVIDLILGSGTSAEKVLVPYIIGLTIEETTNRLQASFLNIGATIYDDCVTSIDSINAKVYKQTPIHSENTAINMGSSVDLWLTCDTAKIKIQTPSVNDSTEFMNE